jgi:hypothetical protein
MTLPAKLVKGWLCAGLMCCASAGQAALVARNLDADASTIEAYYDTLLDISWLADASYAKTSGASADGRFTQAAGSAWAGALNIGGVTGWRLPGVTPLNGSAFDLNFSSLGTTDVGYDITRTGWGGTSEMGYLYYVTLGNDRFALSNTGPFSNLDLGDYWSGVLPDPMLDQTFFFNTSGGLQGMASTAFTLGAWAVHDGDVGAPGQSVPEPGGLALLGVAWVVHTGVRRRVGLKR